MLISGELKQLIVEDGLRGVTSNPAIFEKAISGSDDYLVAEGKKSEEIAGLSRCAEAMTSGF
jgi:transaldolase